MYNQSQSEEPLYNSRTVDIYLKLLRRKYPRLDLEKILEYSQIRPYEVADPGHWFTQQQIDRFYQRLVEETGNAALAREAGRFSASPEAGWALQFLVYGFLSCSQVYEMIAKVSRRLTKSSSYRTKVLSSNKVEITVTPYEGVREKPYQCESRMGYIEAVPLVISNSLPKIEHSECIFRGGECCRYLVTWKEPRSSRLGKIRNYLAAVFFGMAFLACFTAPVWSLHAGIPLGIGFLLLFTLLIERENKKELLENLKRLRLSAENLSEQINVNYNTSFVTNEIGKAINKKLSKEDMLSGMVDILMEKISFDRGFIMLVDETDVALEYKVSFGYDDEQIEYIKKMNMISQNLKSDDIFFRCIQEKSAFFLDKSTDIPARTSFLFHKLGAKTLICCPILYEDQGIGILVVENLNPGRPLLQSDVSLLMGISPLLGLSIRNAEFIDSRERQITSILETLAATIDARDPLTAGHSVKVTEYALGISEELQLPPAKAEVIRVAALLHDYGKVAVPDSILKKPGRLTDEEYEIVKTHACKTREILDRINFEGIYRQVPMIAEAHHEKMDGSGYPKGLKGEEIPMGARIIAVADVYEALTSQRHYRAPMAPEEVLTMLRKQSGRHYDRKVVEALVAYLGKLDKAAFERHHAEDSLTSKILFLHDFLTEKTGRL